MVKKVIGLIFLFVWLGIQLVPDIFFIGVRRYINPSPSETFITYSNEEEDNWPLFFQLIGEKGRENNEEESEESDNSEDSDAVTEYLSPPFIYLASLYLDSTTHHHNLQDLKSLDTFFHIPSPPPESILS